MCKYFYLFTFVICSLIKIERSIASALPELIYPLRMLLFPLYRPPSRQPLPLAILQRVRFSIAAAKAFDKHCSAITKTITIAIANCN